MWRNFGAIGATNAEHKGFSFGHGVPRNIGVFTAHETGFPFKLAFVHELMACTTGLTYYGLYEEHYGATANYQQGVLNECFCHSHG